MDIQNEYEIYFYKNSSNGKKQVEEYLKSLDEDNRIKCETYFQLLKENNGYLDEPYAKHISGKIRELIPKQSRIFYAVVSGKKIILLHAFYKTRQMKKTPENEKLRAIQAFNDFKKNPSKTLEKYL